MKPPAALFSLPLMDIVAPHFAGWIRFECAQRPVG
jgi:hypothetical protein